MIKHKLTIVIPSKNESEIIDKTLTLLNKQYGIYGTNVIISDCSDDNTREVIKSGKYTSLRIKIIDGGLPSVARNNGFKLVKTPYVLFLDADIFLTSPFTISNSLKLIKSKEYHLLTTKFRVEGFYSFVFPIFEFYRDKFMKNTPCAIGGYMFFKTSEFKKLGGFNNDDKFAEDFHLSMKVNPIRFGVINNKVYTTDRRFRKKGLWYMIKMAYLSHKNKNNPNFFKDDQNYWI
jgi:cellulose synthase/poly-beta-1,6-N-acetylglucosamine synthase-like glycosyltransferase